MTSMVIESEGEGTYVYTVGELQPSPRVTATGVPVGPWTHIRASEGTRSYGPWTVLATVPLDPLDEDPENPEIRHVTIAGLSTPDAWVLLEFLDADEFVQPLTPIHTSRPIPSVDEVASRIRQRTQDRDGNLHGTFNEHTLPTAEDADIIIQRAARHVMLKLGDPGSRWSGDLMTSARDAAAARAALEIETSYYAGQGDPGLVDQLGRIAREELEALVSAGKNNQPGGQRFHSLRQVNS